MSSSLALSSRARSSKAWQTSLKAGGAVLILGGFAAVSLVGCPSSGIGDPCVPESEYKEDFSGFTLDAAFVESRSFQCQTRLCLVNHFQGRVSCVRGQAAPKNCNPNNGVDGPCDTGEKCVPAGVIINNCDPTPCSDPSADPNNCNDGKKGGSNAACRGEICDTNGKYCQCKDGECAAGEYCDPKTKLCTTKVCAALNEATLPDTQPDGSPNKAKSHCFVPGTAVPIAAPVCGQCDKNSNHNATSAVYCTCRCAPPADNPSPADDNFNFCKCPDGYDCAEVKANVGLGDAQLAGSYCVKQGTAVSPGQVINCGSVDGYVGKDANCQGQPK